MPIGCANVTPPVAIDHPQLLLTHSSRGATSHMATEWSVCLFQQQTIQEVEQSLQRIVSSFFFRVL